MQPQDPNPQPQPQPPQYVPPAPPPMETPQPTPQPPVHNPLESMQPGEQVICEIKRHPIGIIGTYFSLFAAVALVAVIGYVLGPQLLTTTDTRRIYGYVTIAVLIVAVLGGLFAYVAHIVYWGNRWIVTDDSVTQVIQNSLFSKQSSQLSMGNLEDITAEKNGIFQQMFNFGILRCETAGATKSKFHFAYCPNPEHYAKCILDAREKFEFQHYRNMPNQAAPEGVNQSTAAPGQPGQQ